MSTGTTTPPSLTFDGSLGGLASLDAILLFFATACVVLRFAARLKQKTQFAIDDYLMILAWLSFVGMVAISIFSMADHFAGLHAPKDPAAIAAIHPTMIETYWIIDLFAVLSPGFVKLSVLLFYRRIFCTTKRGGFNIVTWVAIAIVSAWLLVFFIMTFFICGPNLQWYFHVPNTKVCTLSPRYFMGSTISNFILDFFILLLPLPKIWSLHVDTKRKAAITAVFLLALVGLAASCTRMINATGIEIAGKAVAYQDLFQTNTRWQYYIILESGFTIVAANLPCLWYFVAGTTPEKILRSIRSFASLGSSKGSQHSRTGIPLADRTGSKYSDNSSQTSDDMESSHAGATYRVPQTLAYGNTSSTKDKRLETHILGDSSQSHYCPNPTGINVQNSIGRTEEKTSAGSRMG